MWAVITTTKQEVSDLEIENVSGLSTYTVGNFLDELLGIPVLAAPFWLQVRSEYASVIVIARLKFECFFKEYAGVSRIPTFVLSNHLHSDIPLWAFGGKLSSILEDLV